MERKRKVEVLFLAAFNRIVMVKQMKERSDLRGCCWFLKCFQR